MLQIPLTITLNYFADLSPNHKLVNHPFPTYLLIIFVYPNTYNLVYNLVFSIDFITVPANPWFPSFASVVVCLYAIVQGKNRKLCWISDVSWITSGISIPVGHPSCAVLEYTCMRQIMAT